MIPPINNFGLPLNNTGQDRKRKREDNINDNIQIVIENPPKKPIVESNNPGEPGNQIEEDNEPSTIEASNEESSDENERLLKNELKEIDDKLKQLMLLRAKGKLSVPERIRKNSLYAQKQQLEDVLHSCFVLPPRAPGESSMIEYIKHKNLTCEPINGGNSWKIPGENKLYLQLQYLEISGNPVGVCTFKNNRQTMEDHYCVKSDTVKIGVETYEVELYAVFDGHGGDQVAIFVKDNIFQYLMEALQINGLTDEGLFKALNDCCKSLQENLSLKVKCSGTGTTLTAILRLKNKKNKEKMKNWVFNLGDSRALAILPTGKVVQLTQDAKPQIPRYEKKIKLLGGTVSGIRVNDILAVASALGDSDILGVIHTPKIYQCDDFEYIIIGSDGLFDILSTDRVGELVKKWKTKRVDEIADNLVLYATGSHDNITAMVIKNGEVTLDTQITNG